MEEKKELRTVKPGDLFRLKFLQDGQLSPDGKTIAYAVSHIDAEKEEYAAIWLLSLETGESRQLTAGLGMAVGLLFMFAIEKVFVVYGAWMEETFSLSVAALGLASSVIGIAEAMGEGASAGLVDRLGKKKAVLGGLLLNAGAYLLLPLLSGTLVSALVGLFILLLVFEFSIVSYFPLISELAPGARGTLMALNVAALSAGRMAGSLTATPLWLRGGLSLNAVVSCGAALGAFALLLLFVPEPGGSLELER